MHNIFHYGRHQIYVLLFANMTPRQETGGIKALVEIVELFDRRKHVFVVTREEYERVLSVSPQSPLLLGRLFFIFLRCLLCRFGLHSLLFRLLPGQLGFLLEHRNKEAASVLVMWQYSDTETEKRFMTVILLLRQQ